MKKVFAIDQDKMKFRSDFSKIRKGGQGFGINRNNVAYTLNTRDEAWVGIVETVKDERTDE